MFRLGLRLLACAGLLFTIAVQAGSEIAELPGNEGRILAYAEVLPTAVSTWAAALAALTVLCRLGGPLRPATVSLLSGAFLLSLAPFALFVSLDPGFATVTGLLTAHLLGAACGAAGILLGTRVASRPPPPLHGAWSWLGCAAAAVVALALFGEGPAETRINLPVGDALLQLLEIVPFALALSVLGLWNATREETVGPGSWVSWAAAVLGILLTIVFRLDDKGAALIVIAALALVAVWLFDVGRWVPAPLFALVAIGAAVLVGSLGSAHTGTLLALRMAMRADPWWNGLPFGEQLAMALATVENGGWRGVAAWWLRHADLPVGESDFVVPLLAGVFGFPAALLWLATWWRSCATLFSSAAIDHRVFIGARRAPAAVAAVFATKLVIVSWGSLGVTAMTGVCAPLLSMGDTALCVAWFFLGYAVAHVNAPARGTAVAGQRSLGNAIVLVAVLLLPAAWVLADRGTAADRGDDHAGWVTTDAAGQRVFREVPLLARIERRVVRTALLDVDGRPLAITSPSGERIRNRDPALADMIGRPGDVEGTLEATLGDTWPRAVVPPGESAGGVDLRELRRYTRLSPEAFRSAVAITPAVRVGVDRALARRLAPLLSSRLEAEPDTVAAVLVVRDREGRLLAELVARRPGLEAPRFDDVANLASGLRAAPGSQLKILLAAAADVSGVPRDVVLHCDKAVDGRGRVRVCSPAGCEVIRDYPRGRHGAELSIREAMECSCNAGSIELALLTDPSIFASMYAQVADVLPPDLSNPHLLAETAIGQGVANLTAEEVSAFMLALGTDGVLRPGRLGEGAQAVLGARLVPEATAGWTALLMDGVVNGDHGTAKGARLEFPLRAIGKTGSAQEGPRDDDPYPGDDAWFSGVLHDDNGAAIAYTFLAVHADVAGGTWAKDVPPLAAALQAEGYLAAPVASRFRP